MHNILFKTSVCFLLLLLALLFLFLVLHREAFHHSLQGPSAHHFSLQRQSFVLFFFLNTFFKDIIRSFFGRPTIVLNTCRIILYILSSSKDEVLYLYRRGRLDRHDRYREARRQPAPRYTYHLHLR